MSKDIKLDNRFAQSVHAMQVGRGMLRITVDDKVDVSACNLTEAQAIELRDFLNKAYPVAKNKDVTTILLNVVPGPDGMGHEVYAESVEQVERRLCDLGDKLEEATERANLEASRADALVALHNEGPQWMPAHLPPKGGEDKWTDPVVAITNLGEVVMCSYFNGKDGGVWQRPSTMAKGASVAFWMPLPKGFK